MRDAGETATAVSETWKRKGVKRLTHWFRLPYLDMAKDMCIDYMHIGMNNGSRTRKMLAPQPNVDMRMLQKAVRKWSPTPNMRQVSLLICTLLITYYFSVR